ncbi:penicillin-binding protein 2 [Clostridium cavendishii DSM 21758]|uniref:Penicillin-binding protein 2 n=1 Tax=Clostridium cavendishii DSM 21758 TaxID=1121302 RepID=A0A1M6BKB4_9CLOT|nr:penicillin-binding transpeptidase domain-containing protein [Clostridium cavendishii]SHI49172.1 penicillin-binding protein 2 [Clostridium cavendishii DSM 21758]
MNNTKKKKKDINRYSILLSIMLIIFIAIISRLIYLQVYKYDDFKDRANTRAQRFLATKAPRGKIYDSNGNILATNKQTYTVTFTETDESKKQFYKTMDSVISLLSDNKEALQDKLKLKLDDKKEPYFDFSSDSDSVTKAQEIRFKRDRGLNDEVKKRLYPKKKDDLKEEEENKIDQELLKYTPKQTFEFLVKAYSLYDLLIPYDIGTKSYNEEAKKYINMTSEEVANAVLAKYPIEKIRNYMIVKDAIKMQSFSGFKPVTIASNIKQPSAFVFEQKLSTLPGIDIALEPMREYPYGELGASFLGYVSTINSSNKNVYEERGYDVSTDLIGKTGIESAFENVLKGTKGGNTVNVNAEGRKIEDLFTLETYPGNNVHLTIDKDIQYSAETMLKSQLEFLQKKGIEGDIDFRNATRGAAVAIEVKTGRVLAMVSLPGYDPNLFATGDITTEISKKYFSPDLEAFGNQYIKYRGLNTTVDTLFPKNKDGIRQDPYDIYPKPFLNYATMGLIPPGSTFKPLTSLAALSEGVTNPSETMADKIVFDKYPEIFGATKPKDNDLHGVVNLASALAKSCNYYYYDMGIRLYYKNKEKGGELSGLNSLAKYAWAMGLGVDPNSNTKAATGIEISENFGHSYNFNDFKDLKLNYAKWNFRDYLGSGIFPSRGTRFTPLDINSATDDKTDKLEAAKEKLKNLVNNKLKEIGINNISTNSSYNEFEKQVKESLQAIYDNSDDYKKAMEGKKVNPSSEITTTAKEIANWVIYSMPIEIMTPVEVANASIGQGMNNFTPLQIADYIATLVNGGTRYKTHLVDKITDIDGKVVKEFKPEAISHMDIDKGNLAAIKEGMRQANEVDMGTASYVFKSFPISSGGKTGTATFRDDQKNFGREAYGVYVSMAPVEDPEIAVCVAIYDGGHGYFGASVARAIYETYWRNKLKTEFPNYKPMDMSGNSYDYSLNPPTENIKDVKSK